jgi:hypothetical protein
MELKSDKIWDKLQERLTTVDPNTRSLIAIFQVHLKSGGEVAKSIGKRTVSISFCTIRSVKNYTFYPTFSVLDLKDVKLFVGTVDNADAVLTLDDDDFCLIAAKQTTFAKLLEEVNLTKKMM